MTTSDDDNDEPHGLGHWMIEYELNERVKHGIVCEKLPSSSRDAKFMSVASWEQWTGKNWIEYLNF